MHTAILTRLAATVWAIEPRWLEALAHLALRQADADAVLALRAERVPDGAPVAPVALTVVNSSPLDGGRMGARYRDGVAVLPVMGPIIPHAGSFAEMSGATSVDTIQANLRAAAANPDVRAVMLAVDSPGGAVPGVSEVADQIAAFPKPVEAYVHGSAASAAYWIASQARRITAADTAMLGSIGVMATVSVQEGPNRDGRRSVEVVSSNAANKRPDVTTEEGLATLRAALDEAEAVFLAAVARGRGVPRADVPDRFGRGGIKVGRAAVAAGMADAIGTLDGALAALSDATRADATRPRTRPARTALAQAEARARAADLPPRA